MEISKNLNKYILFFIVAMILIIFVIWQIDKGFQKEMSKYIQLNSTSSLNLEVTSREFVDKWFIINDSINIFAKGIGKQKEFIFDYIRNGDVLLKKRNNDTITVLREGVGKDFILLYN